MTCDECKALLLALVEGDLPPEQASEVRRVAEGCPECRAELDAMEAAMRMASQLPTPAVPAGLFARVMEVASEQVDKPQAVPAGPAAGRASDSNIVRGWLHFVERFANGPQFGMATIMLLLLAGTFWVVPNLPRRHGATGDSVATVEAPAGGGADTGLLAPAEELDLAVDMRRGRLRRRGEAGPHPQRAASPQGDAAGQAGGLAVPGEATVTVDEVEAEAPALAAAPTAKSASAADPGIAPVDEPLDGQAELADPADPAVGARAGYEAGPVTAVFEAPPSPPAAAAPGAAASGAAADVSTPAAQVAAAPAKKDASAEKAASAKPEAPEQKAAKREPAWATPLREARKARAAGHCADAVLVYDGLIERRDLPPVEARRVLREALDCHGKLGNQARVDELRKALGPVRKAKKRSPKSKAGAPPAADAFQPTPAN